MKSKTKLEVGTGAGEAVSAPAAVTPAALTNILDLQAICEQTLTVEITMNDKPFAIECKRLNPAQDAALEAILNAVVPPIERGQSMDQDRPKFNDPGYIQARGQAIIEARSLGLYWAVPIINQGKPGMTDRKAIVEYVQSKLNRDILDILWAAVRDGGVQESKLRNFTSPNG